jgi:hypothetical protein
MRGSVEGGKTIFLSQSYEKNSDRVIPEFANL